MAYLPDEGRVATLDPGPTPGTWRAAGRDDVLKFCANRDSPALCNWMTSAESGTDYCIACRLNRTIPNLDDADNRSYWAKIEIAKRRVVSELFHFGLLTLVISSARPCPLPRTRKAMTFIPDVDGRPCRGLGS